MTKDECPHKMGCQVIAAASMAAWMQSDAGEKWRVDTISHLEELAAERALKIRELEAQIERLTHAPR